MSAFRIPVLMALGVAIAVGVAVGEDLPAKKRRPQPQEFGRVVIRNRSEQAGLAPVVFDHWVHRAKFTCRLCHVDIGFAMKGGATDIRAADNARGQYCGACHDGRTQIEGKKTFEACPSPGEPASGNTCVRCHSLGKDVKPTRDFATFARGMPRGRFGNGIDWEQAELEKSIKPIDFLPEVSIRRSPLTVQKDFSLNPKLLGMPDIIFSHAKHTVWNGCELCHPEIFVGVKRGATRYSMVEIFQGKYCGACHTTVAFPLLDCQRCHSRPVR
jgi:c(7)-type cytochrome triheme protein